jgi:CBS domain-containing protein
MKTHEALRKPPATVEADRTVQEAAQLMDRLVVGALVVTDHGSPVGIVTDRDVVVRGVATGKPLDARIDSLMSTDLVTLDGDADVRASLATFRTHPYRRLPVVEQGELVGMVTVDDLLVDVVADLGDLVRPITGQVIFGYPEPAVPVPSP